MILKCDECGEETNLILYIDKKRYCYSCYYAVKRQEAKEYKAYISPLAKKIKKAYRRGMKPSEIAKQMNISTKEVYERLNEAIEGDNENSR